MPAHTGIQFPGLLPLDSRFRGNDARSQGLAVYLGNGHLDWEQPLGTPPSMPIARHVHTV